MMLQNSTSGTFSKMSCNAESETIPTNFSYSTALNLSVTLYFEWIFLSTYDFTTPCIGHLENTGSLSDIVLPHADTLGKK